MHVAVLSPIAWRTPPKEYGPWEQVVSLLAEGLIEKDIDVTLFATGNSQTKAKLHAIAPHGYEEDRSLIPKVWECLHISEVFERASDFDLIHNHFDFLPLTFSRLVKTPVVTTIHGFSSPGILPVYEKYDDSSYYVAISNSDKSTKLHYIATVYHGIDIKQFTFREHPEGDYLIFLGRIHPDKGTKEAIEIASNCGLRLIIAGIIQDQAYFDRYVSGFLKDGEVDFVGSVGPNQRDDLLGNALALLHPISFDEPFGLSVVESMACGTPVIAFNKGSMPEIITDGVDGFLVRNVEEAILAVGRIKSIERGVCRKTIQDRFTVSRMVDEYIAVYQKVLNGENRT